MTLRTLLTVIVLVIATISATHAQTSTSESDTLKTIAGKWAGTYAGDSSGKFELAVNQDANQKLTGQITILTDDGNRHPITLKTISWKNGQLNATYIDPSENDEVVITGRYTNPDLEGNWKSDEGQATGTWQLTRVNP
ncbi:MAG: hypothetical protein INR73_29505 [Williamsia sp.]|nr:hypothetical protein [Williamsia sp.]